MNFGKKRIKNVEGQLRCGGCGSSGMGGCGLGTDCGVTCYSSCSRTCAQYCATGGNGLMIVEENKNN